MKNFIYFKIPFGAVVNSKYVLTIRFNNGFNIGIGKHPLRLIHMGFYQD